MNKRGFQIRINEMINPDSWRSFVFLHPLGNIFQTPEMYKLYCQTGNNSSLAIAIEIDEEIVGLLLANFIGSKNPIAKPLTSRSIIIGGPLAANNDSDIIDSLFKEYIKRLPHYIVYSEIRPITDFSFISEVCMRTGFTHIGHFSLSLIIDKEELELWENLHKERRRNVRKAQNAGLVFKEITGQEEIEQVVFLIRQTYKRKRVPLSHDDLLKQASSVLHDRIRYFAAFLEGKMIAGQIRLFYKDLAYAWYAGSDESYFKFYPNDFLMWNVICWSKENGYKIFDFGGGGEPGIPYGVRDYKLKYGCEIHDYGRFIFYHHPLVYRAAKFGMRLLRMKKA